ncbi:MAG TPA: hypothetical protein VLF87_00820 [Patescibacteria group bacterium]|nr:hypothetical protein [Patescibacteria group bacterium]
MSYTSYPHKGVSNSPRFIKADGKDSSLFSMLIVLMTGIIVAVFLFMYLVTEVH